VLIPYKTGNKAEDQLEESLIHIYLPRASHKIPFALSTHPWLCGCLGLPRIKTKSGKRVFNSVITTDTNSRPLSLCKIRGGPKTKNNSHNFTPTSAADLFLKGNAQENLLK